MSHIEKGNLDGESETKFLTRRDRRIAEHKSRVRVQEQQKPVTSTYEDKWQYLWWLNKN